MKISIVTPSFNQAPFLEATARSVLGQKGDFELQWIVADGGSTDGTVPILQAINDPRVTWQSQPDRGQSDAINRAMKSVTGEIVGWLNSDDLYHDDTLSTVMTAFADPAVQWLVGGYEIIDEAGRPIRSSIVRYKQWALRKYSYRALLRENFIAQPAVFWRRSFAGAGPLLDESLHYTMDYDLWLRFGRQADPRILDQPLAQFRIHSQSKSGQVNREQFDEGYRVASRYFAGDEMSRRLHRFNVEKIVAAYRLMRWIGM